MVWEWITLDVMGCDTILVHKIYATLLRQFCSIYAKLTITFHEQEFNLTTLKLMNELIVYYITRVGRSTLLHFIFI